jgi:hypothetical protein
MADNRKFFINTTACLGKIQYGNVRIPKILLYLTISTCLTAPLGVLLAFESEVATKRHTLQYVIEVQEESLTLINVTGECQFQHCLPEQRKHWTR